MEVTIARFKPVVCDYFTTAGIALLGTGAVERVALVAKLTGNYSHSGAY
jgi:hypothetical protein